MASGVTLKVTKVFPGCAAFSEMPDGVWCRAISMVTEHVQPSGVEEAAPRQHCFPCSEGRGTWFLP